MTKAEQIKKESRERTEKWIEDNLMPVFEETLEIDGVPVMVSPLEQFRERARAKDEQERLKENNMKAHEGKMVVVKDARFLRQVREAMGWDHDHVWDQREVAFTRTPGYYGGPTWEIFEVVGSPPKGTWMRNVCGDGTEDIFYFTGWEMERIKKPLSVKHEREKGMIRWEMLKQAMDAFLVRESMGATGLSLDPLKKESHLMRRFLAAAQSAELYREVSVNMFLDCLIDARKTLDLIFELNADMIDENRNES